jgi:hypothetical protein
VDNYIIRIYRRDPRDPHKIIGMAEAVETEEKVTFTSLDKLQSILNQPKTGQGKRRIARKSKGSKG